MQRQGALADATFAGAHGHEMAHPGEPVGDAGALTGNLFEDSGPSVADDVVVALHRHAKFDSLHLTNAAARDHRDPAYDRLRGANTGRALIGRRVEERSKRPVGAAAPGSQ